MNASIAALAYLVAGVLFILSLRGLSSPETSRRGNTFGMIGMALAVGVTVLTLWSSGALDLLTAGLIVGGVVVGGGAGAVIAGRVQMTQMPQLVAAFHSLVGMAACLVAVGAVYAPDSFGIATAAGGIKTLSIIELSLGVAIGAITFTGSVIAFAKLNGNMSGAPILLPARHLINIALALALVLLIGVMIGSGGTATWAFWGVFILALILGATLIIPIGGADMPVVVSMLNSYSGWAAAALGFTLENIAVKQGSAEDAAFIMKNASKVIIVPGYGMAVAQAQHALREMADKLKEEGVDVKYAIHPVAGRMPGHMNVLLAEANVPYDEVFELEDINSEFGSCDVAFVIGANDVTNPAAKTDPTSAIYGMPILDVEKAGTVLFIKRGMAAGYAGVENELFFRDNTMMLFADAKKMVEGIVKAL
ncbi:MAG: NAD(P)(+) transhydrogenase (Re/Si-specific) subunit beta [Brevundimonas sp.]|nr:MAG: NAD(P)(+) transhydrogenase (Re/Si-specific) subunit beta [Brevundimonas sp.]